MNQDKDIIIQALIEDGQFNEAGKRMGKTLQTLKTGEKKWETQLQTNNRRLKEHAAEINKANGAIQKRTSFIKRMGMAFIGADLAVRGTLAAFRAFQNATKFVIGAGMAMEDFRTRLDGVSSSAELADIQLKKIRDFAAKTPLLTEDVVAAFVQLKAIGIPSAFEVTEALGNVAVQFGKSVEEILPAFVGLNKKTLRPLGVQLDRTGQKAVLMSGNMRLEVEKTDDAIRAGLLEIWRTRFPDAMDKAKNRTSASIAVMKSEFTELGASVSTGIMPILRTWATKVGQITRKMRSSFDIGSLPLEEQLDKSNAKIRELLSKVIEWNKGMSNPDNSVARNFMEQIAAERLLLQGIKFRIQERDRLLAQDKAVEEANANARKSEQDKANSIKESLKLNALALSALKRELKLKRDLIRENEKEAQTILDAAMLKLEYASQVTEGLGSEWERQKRQLDIEQQERRLQAINQGESLLEIDRLFALKRKQLNDQMQEARRQSMVDSATAVYGNLGKIYENAEKNDKKRAQRAKAVAIGQATIQTYLAANKAFQEFGGVPLGIGPMIASIAVGLSNVGAIASQKFAAGTKFAPGGLSMVGERGPELMRVPRGAEIVNNAQSNSVYMGGIQITVQGNATPESAQGIRLAAKDVAKALEQAARNGFLTKYRIGLAS